MKSVLALDQGTTGSTALVIGEDGSVRGRAYREFTQHFPRPGWVEHDAAEIWSVTLEVAQEAVAAAAAIPDAIGITNQRETIAVWDRASGEPLYNAIVWQDRRTAERCRHLNKELGSAYLAAKTGLTWDPYFSATKIEWLLQNVDTVRERVLDGSAAIGTVDSWLIFKLCGQHVTDYTNASRTMLYNLQTRNWDSELAELFGIPVEALPRITGSSEIVGESHEALFGRPIPIAGNAGDQQAALYGQGCWEPGQAKCTYGTGAFLLYLIGDDQVGKERGGLLTTVACHADGSPTVAVEGSIFIAGAAIQWLRDGLGLIEHAAESESLARAVDDTGGVYLVPAFVGLGAPHWEAEARGALLGITRGTRREHVVRAALEAMAFSVRELIESIPEGPPLTQLRVDGGASQNDWLAQFQADLLGVAVERPDMVETTALGAAGLAGLATGVWRSPSDFVAARTYTRFEPRATRDAEFAGWRRAVDAVLHWART